MQVLSNIREWSKEHRDYLLSYIHPRAFMGDIVDNIIIPVNYE